MSTNNHKTIIFRTRLKTMSRLLAIMAGILLISSPAFAAPLGLILFDSPDLYFNNASVTYDSDYYDADTGQLVITAHPVTIDFDGPGGDAAQYIELWDEVNYPYSFTIQVKMDHEGNIIEDGNSFVEIEGYLAGWNSDPPPDGWAGSGVILTGDLIDRVGFHESGLPGWTETLEFLFDPTGGDAEGLYDAVGYRAGIILSFSDIPQIENVWASSWSSDGSPGYGDIRPIPIPGAVWLFGSGLVGLLGLRRKFRKA